MLWVPAGASQSLTEDCCAGSVPTPHHLRRDVRPGMLADAFEPVAEKLLLVLSHLFQTVPLHRAILQQPERFKSSPSKVVVAHAPVGVARLGVGTAAELAPGWVWLIVPRPHEEGVLPSATHSQGLKANA